jgi:hypothetical protein
MPDPAWLQARPNASLAASAIREPGSAAVARQRGADAANPQETRALAVPPELGRHRRTWETPHAGRLVRLVADFRVTVESEQSPSVPEMAATGRAAQPASRATAASQVARERPVSMAPGDWLAAFPKTAAIPDRLRSRAPVPERNSGRRVPRPAARTVPARHVVMPAHPMAADTAEAFRLMSDEPRRPRLKRRIAKNSRCARPAA